MGVLLAYAGLVPLQELMVAQGQRRDAHRASHARQSRGAPQERPGVHARGGQHSRDDDVDVDQPAGRRDRRVRARGVGVSARARRGNVGGDARPAMDDCAGDRRAGRDAQHPRGHELRQTGAAPEQRAGHPRTVLARRQQPGAGRARAASRPARCCSTILNRDDIMAMGTDEDTRRDLLLLLPVDTSQQVTDLHIQLLGRERAAGDGRPTPALDNAAPHLETRTYPNDSGPADANGHHIVTGWVARVPVTLNPTKPWDIGGDRYPLTVKASYRVAGRSQPRAFSARAAIDAQVASGIYEMGIASSHPALLLSWRGDHALEADAMSAGTEYAIETDGLTRRFGEFTAVDRRHAQDPEGPALRIPGPQRRGQDDHDPRPHHAPAAERGHREALGTRRRRQDPLAVRRLVGLVSDETSESQSTWTAREYLSYFARIRHLPDPADHVERICSMTSASTSGSAASSSAPTAPA